MIRLVTIFIRNDVTPEFAEAYFGGHLPTSYRHGCALMHDPGFHGDFGVMTRCAAPGWNLKAGAAPLIRLCSCSLGRVTMMLIAIDDQRDAVRSVDALHR